MTYQGKLPQPFEHTETLYLVDIREAEPVAVFKLHIFFLLLVISFAVGVELQPGGHRQVVGNAGNPRPRSVPLDCLSHLCPTPHQLGGRQGAEDNLQVDIVVFRDPLGHKPALFHGQGHGLAGLTAQNLTLLFAVH